MATTTYSYDLQNTIRDLSEAFEVIKKQKPTILSLIKTGKPATHYKHEWLNEVLEPVADALNGAIADTDTSAVVDDSTKFKVGDIITFNDANYELCKITAINTSSHTLTITRGYAGTTAAAHADNTEVRLVSRPKTEGTTADPDSIHQPTVLYNYTQIFRQDAKITRTASKIKQYGINNLVNKAVSDMLTKIYWELVGAVIYSGRYANTSDSSVPRTMGGLLWWLSQSGAIKSDAGGATLTSALLNNLIAEIADAGGHPDTILCGVKQARAISKLNADASSNIVRMIDMNTRVTGSFVTQFQSEIPNFPIANIVVDMNMPDDKILLIDSTKLALVPLEGSAMKDFDSTPPGFDGIVRSVLGEYTLEIRNPNEAHGMLYNLG
ncbi:MAG: hypothetical protein DRI01_00675 [Chloroflexi bacterium]|nr:MAG: hypothetical protein DRI01_00675 [Chloroflexota bacterium]